MGALCAGPEDANRGATPTVEITGNQLQKVSENKAAADLSMGN